jgi:kynureninase
VTLAGQLAPHYSRFRVAERLLLTGHSHQAWPDVARDAQLEAYDDAAAQVDDKWERAFAKAEQVRAGVRALLHDTADVALGASTHELVLRFLSAVDLRHRRRLVTTEGEFHTIRRQLARLGEDGLHVVRVPVGDPATLAERLAAQVDGRTAAVLVSACLFETSRLVPHLAVLAESCEKHGAELLVDAYHVLGCVPFPVPDLGLARAWVVGGGYKYLQLGEGCCFLRLPPQAARMRPVITGWYAEFADLPATHDPNEVVYGEGASRFAGSTYDPTSHYRGARVLAFFREQGLTDDVLRSSYQHQLGVLADAVDGLGLPEHVVGRDRDVPLTELGGFLSLRTPHAARLQHLLKERGVSTDSRGQHLRLGPAPYLSDDQLREAVAVLGEVAGG